MNSFWGMLPSGETVHKFILQNGMFSADVSELGATLLAFRIPDRNGKLKNVVLCHEMPEAYLAGTSYLGATVGRYANRIGSAHFVLDGKDFALSQNENGNCLHGGTGLHNKCWRVIEETDTRVTFFCVSPDGEDGFPGTLSIRVTYSLASDGVLSIIHEAATDRDTVVSLTCHPYFNLGGSLADHLLQIQADGYTPVDDFLIPTGSISVLPFEMDFRTPRRIGSSVLDLNFVLNGFSDTGASLHDPFSGRTLSIASDLPGLQIYTADSLQEGALSPRDGVAIEAQFFPDSPNVSAFPSTTLRASDYYHHEIRFIPGVK